MCFTIFPFHLFKVLRLPRKSEARSYEVLHLSRKIIVANLKISCSKMQRLSGNQGSPSNSSDEHVSCTASATENASLQIFKCPTPAMAFANTTNHHVLPIFCKVQNPMRLPHKTASERPKMLRARQFLTSKCASRHNYVHLLNISTSKSGPSMWCFEHFHFQVCFAPQWRALFEHLNFQKWSEHVVF